MERTNIVLRDETLIDKMKANKILILIWVVWLFMMIALIVNARADLAALKEEGPYYWSTGKADVKATAFVLASAYTAIALFVNWFCGVMIDIRDGVTGSR